MDHERYGFKVVKWDFPPDDSPHCDLVLGVGTNLKLQGDGTYSFFGCALPYQRSLDLLIELRESIGVAIRDIETRVKK